MNPIVEICVDRIDSVAICAQAKVDRIELCAALSEGGLTPSLGFLRQARQIFAGKIMMMIRPRAGDFLYRSDDIQTMKDDILQAKQHGADGVVFGCLDEDGMIDEALTRELMEDAGGLEITFHRAFDVTPHLAASLETLIDLGIPRVLTSGGEANVWLGASRLAELVNQAAGRIVILPGGGVTAIRVPELLVATGCHEVHLSARCQVASSMRHRRDDIPMGAATVSGEYVHKVVDREQLALLKP